MFAFPFRKLFPALVSAVVLAACSSAPEGPARTTGTALPPPAVGESTSGDLRAAPPPLPEPESTSEMPPGGAAGEPADEAAGGVVIEGPEGTSWTARTAKDEEAYRADVEDCHRYANAQTRHDAQMIDDRNAGIDTLTSDSRYSALRQRVDEFDLRNRRSSLMSSCMESKGYASSDTVLPRLEF